MKKIKKLGIIGVSGILALGSAVGIGIAVSQSLKTTNNLPSKNVSGLNGSTNSPTFNQPIFDELDNNKTFLNVETTPETGKYKMTIVEPKDESKKHGTIVFVNEQNEELGTSITANANEKVSVKAKITNEEYTLTDLKVYAEGNSSIQLAVEKNGDIYSFVLPPEQIEGPFGGMIENPFYNGKTDLVVESVYGKAKHNGWIYDFETRTYSIYIEQDNFVFDETTDEQLKLIAGETGELLQYRVYLNNHDVKIKKLTVPQNTQLMFINNKENSNPNGKVPVISIEDNNSLTVNGAIGRWGSVEYSEELFYFLGHWHRF